MSSISVCVRFRPLSTKEKEADDAAICVKGLDSESFIFKGEKEEELAFCFDKVFYQDAEQEDVFEYLAMPVVLDAMNGINGTILTYGQTGAGKTYSMEGPNISGYRGEKKGLLPRAVDKLFEQIKHSEETTKLTVKISMVEIYMEKVRDLFDLSKDNLQIKESKTQGIFLSGVTEVTISNAEDALKCLSRGIANRAVGETQMNMASSRSHCVYIFLVHQESSMGGWSRTGKLVLVDLAGSEKVEKSGAEGKVLDEAKTINKSLSALGNVINALTSGKGNHIPYRDSKLTRILQDTVGGNSRTALLCCCSPSSLNASESLSTLRFGTRTKLVKTTPLRNPIQETPTSHSRSNDGVLEKLRMSLSPDNVRLLEEVLMAEGVLFDPQSTEELEAAVENTVSRCISSMQETIEELNDALEKLSAKYEALVSERSSTVHVFPGTRPALLDMISGTFSALFLRFHP
ncbi:ATP binding microtubule motor family protein [Wolffia australiana]